MLYGGMKEFTNKLYGGVKEAH